jgi:hypothetical protein
MAGTRGRHRARQLVTVDLASLGVLQLGADQLHTILVEGDIAVVQHVGSGRVDVGDGRRGVHPAEVMTRGPDQRWTLRTLTSAINARPSNNLGLP